MRGYRGDGSAFNQSDSIDLIPQAFSVFSKMEEEKINSALEKAYHTLWDPQRKLIRLLDPPYVSQTDGVPGSIADYPPE